MTEKSPSAVKSLSLARLGAGEASGDVVARETGAAATACTIASIAGDPQGVVRESAAFLESLLHLWRLAGVDPETVWTELHARIEMGELSLRLSRSPTRTGARRMAPWRVATSKLP
ncbi:phosphoribosyl-ATP pyrophosphatase [Acetobacter sacchari]|uniref:Phosphoribosyl-ATP pyrophosphatase n=1 Tax=Acetobacter sacchari TaxID=2661687 RepID=A0ABS3LZ50_9PROT|nr:phosphoribosyl-ATP pyrophosphatase [Acetobacter sacchari]MBO1361190.1 phosphoribosyl-ATP pyrophosphatase [Acetobacter sacchari]